MFDCYNEAYIFIAMESSILFKFIIGTLQSYKSTNAVSDAISSSSIRITQQKVT